MLRSPPPAASAEPSDKSTSSFPLQPKNRFTGPCAVVKQPVEITCFSYDKQRTLHHDPSSLVPSPPALPSGVNSEILLPRPTERGSSPWIRRVSQIWRDRRASRFVVGQFTPIRGGARNLAPGRFRYLARNDDENHDGGPG